MIASSFGHWLAGFIDGEGCFYITTTTPAAAAPGALRPKFVLSLRADDRRVIETAREQLGGLGRIDEYEPSSPGKRTVRWSIQAQADLESLCAVLDAHPLRSKKSNDYLIWREAVAAAGALRRGSAAARSGNAAIYAFIKKCKDEIAVVRAYKGM